MKKAWEKPQLVVLVRSTPEESLIIWCKGTLGPGSDPNATFTACQQEQTTCLLCVQYGTS